MKDFDKWNEVKKRINRRNYPPIKIGEVYWCIFGINVGVEQDGDRNNFQRPVIILKKYSNQLVLVAPLTTKIHKGNWFMDILVLNKKSQIILNQIRPVDTRRVLNQIGEVSVNKVRKILRSFIELISS